MTETPQQGTGTSAPREVAVTYTGRSHLFEFMVAQRPGPVIHWVFVSSLAGVAFCVNHRQLCPVAEHVRHWCSERYREVGYGWADHLPRDHQLLVEP